MKLIIQTVTKASVLIDQTDENSIDKGLLVYVGFNKTDNTQNIDKAIYKLSGLRVFNDSNDKINLSLRDFDGEILVISNFTLYASLKKGFRPSFDDAMGSQDGITLYNDFIDKLKKEFPGKVKTGKFGANMLVTSVNDGPKNYILEC